MTKVIKVDQTKVRIPKDDLINNINIIDEYVSLLNGISYACHRYDEYSEGYRNTIAVDLTVASYMLGLDAQEVLKEFVIRGLIDPLKDDEAPIARVDRVLNYRYKFDWDWMIDPDQYLLYDKFVKYAYEDHDSRELRYADGFDDTIKLLFKIV